MKFDIDLTKAPRIRAVPDGVYILKILSGELKKSKAQNDKITWKLEITQPTAAREISQFMYHDSSLVDTALWRLQELYEAVGRLHTGGFSMEEVLGASVGAIVSSEETKDYGLRS